MKITKKQEAKFLSAVKQVKTALKRMTVQEAEDFVLYSASPNTLRNLRALQDEIKSWGFDRLG